MTYDVIVIGLGAHGSATAYQLGRRGQKVLGIEAFERAHDLGSSGGLSRIIRLAYFEHPDYVPMLRAAWELWPQIEAETGAKLLLQTGGLYCGRLGSGVLDGSLRSARDHGLPHELLDASETLHRFPALHLDEDMQALHEPLAGLLFPERCIEAHLGLAEQSGAELRFGERVVGWQRDGSGISVTTDRATYVADRLVLAAGAWLAKLVPDLDLPLHVERNPLFWFEPAADAGLLAPDRLPVWIVELDAQHAFYGFPDLPEQGFKAARHHGGLPTDPDTLDRQVHESDEAPVRRFLQRYLPAGNGRRLRAQVCMYTNTPDFNFVVDFHPADDRVLLLSPCSGHGFKFSAVIGAIAADLVTSGTTTLQVDFMSLARFQQPASKEA
ncbi:MAG TPA: N-methyl-L-tryptophan oxidase [Candidatus Limnocylindria bacterium]|nr:N-methyl-L-tryptophan oxidase [Candidatus Limnocylindria bacterium]